MPEPCDGSNRLIGLAFSALRGGAGHPLRTPRPIPRQGCINIGQPKSRVKAVLYEWIDSPWRLMSRPICSASGVTLSTVTKLTSLRISAVRMPDHAMVTTTPTS